MLHGWHIGVVIPARDEEDHIAGVVEGLPEIVDMAVVVNDGSKDATQERAASATTHCQVVLIEGNGDGVGASIDRGHRVLLERFNGSFISVVMAGDGQMNPDDLEQLIQPIVSGIADHVKGNRAMHEEGLNRMPAHRQRATKVLSWFTTLASGQRVGDPQCGFTATSSTVLRDWDWHRSWPGYGYPNFWLINLSSKGYRIAERPVQSIYRNESSGIKPRRFFTSVGWMMTVEHHRRNVSWLHPKRLTPHTLFAFLSYLLGWSALIPQVSNDLEVELMARGVPGLAICLVFWTIAHVFDRSAARVQRELRGHATT
jgi:glycosyltransferase involved in cell wall biosynthesis